jgi:hypothetical protein
MFHPEKCTTIHISKKRNLIHTGYKLHGHTLESVPGSKYLGVHVNKDPSAKIRTGELTTSGRSLIKARNKSGPRTVP